MALITCEECKKEISDQAKKCPNCGVKIKSGTMPIIIIGAIVIGAFASLSSNEKSTSNHIEPAPEQNITIKQELVAPLGTNVWEYTIPIDEVSGKASYNAILKSNNIVDLDFPYQGGTQATLVVRKHPRNGLNVFIAINKGQLNCQYDNCYIPIRFDDGPVIKNYVTEPTDNSNLAFFLSKENNTISNIKKSKKMYIELTFFSQGTHTFEFNTDNFDANHLNY